MTERLFVGFVLFQFCCAFSNAEPSPPAAGGQQSPSALVYSPAPGSLLRKEILDYVRPFCEHELHQPVIFNVLTLSVSNDGAMGVLIPLGKSRQAIPKIQRYLVILSRARNTWRLETLRQNPNDAEIANSLKWFVLPTTPPQRYANPSPQSGTSQTEAEEKRRKDLDQREAELNHRASELDKRAAEIQRQTAANNEKQPTQSTQKPSAIEGPPNEVVEAAFARYGNPPGPLKRGQTLASKRMSLQTGGSVPEGTLVFPIKKGTGTAVIYFYQNEFGEWKAVAPLVSGQFAPLN